MALKTPPITQLLAVKINMDKVQSVGNVIHEDEEEVDPWVVCVAGPNTTTTMYQYVTSAILWIQPPTIKARRLPQASTANPGIHDKNPAAKLAEPKVSKSDCVKCKVALSSAAYTPKLYVGPPVAETAKSTATKMGILDKKVEAVAWSSSYADSRGRPTPSYGE